MPTSFPPTYLLCGFFSVVVAVVVVVVVKVVVVVVVEVTTHKSALSVFSVVVELEPAAHEAYRLVQTPPCPAGGTPSPTCIRDKICLLAYWIVNDKTRASSEKIRGRSARQDLRRRTLGVTIAIHPRPGIVALRAYLGRPWVSKGGGVRHCRIDVASTGWSTLSSVPSNRRPLLLPACGLAA